MSDKTPWRIQFASAGRAILRAAPSLTTDGAALAGAGFVAYGAGLVYRPAGFIVLGALLIIGAFLSAKGKA